MIMYWVGKKVLGNLSIQNLLLKSVRLKKNDLKLALDEKVVGVLHHQSKYKKITPNGISQHFLADPVFLVFCLTSDDDNGDWL